MSFWRAVGRFFTGASTTINPGAVIPITVRVPEVYPRVANCLYDQSSDHPLSIGMHESWNKACGEILHEAVHAFEFRLMQAGNIDGARIVRHAFLDMQTPDFVLGYADLMEEIP